MLNLDPSSLRAFPAELRQRYLKAGWWDDSTLGHSLIEWLGRHPQMPYCIWSPTRPQVSTYGAVLDQSLRLAEGLRRRGIGTGDTVCIYVNNSIEGALGFHAVPALGAILVPVAPFYGTKELRFILSKSKARILITAESPAGNRLEHIAEMRAQMPDLEDVYVIGDKIPTTASWWRMRRSRRCPRSIRTASRPSPSPPAPRPIPKA
jgi:acyl-CoA synthetase